MASDGFATWFLGRVVVYLLSPFASWDTFIHSISGVVTALTDLNSKTAWLYLLSSVGVAWWLYRSQKRDGLAGSFLAFAFPPDVYRHPSALADYRYVFVDLTIKLVLYVPFVSGVGFGLYKALVPLVGGPAVDGAWLSPVARSILATTIAFIVADFGFFLAHYLMHHVRWLWPFHEVHHSAEVLTPVTVHRVHPVEELTNAIVAGLVGAFGATTYTSLTGKSVEPITMLGVNVLTFGYFMFAFQLRHSHLWLSYPPIVSRLLISPAQHQIHHSVDPRHWNKNFGFTFAVWDWMFRSLYVPRSREHIRFGLPGADPRDFATVPRLYFLPFVKAFRTLSPKRVRQIGAPPPREPSLT